MASKHTSNLIKLIFFGIATGPLVIQSPALAAWPDLPASPIVLQAQADPNIAVTLDDSGSMAWAYVPDAAVAQRNTRRIQAARFNPLAYNPFQVYTPPYSAALDGTRLSTSFNSARINGFDASRGTVNLATSYQSTLSYNPASTGQAYNNNPATGTTAGVPAYFYAFYNDLDPGNNPPEPGTNAATFSRRTTLPSGCPGITATNDEDCYIRVAVPASHQQNFANWYSFYRTRNLLTVSAANIAFYSLNPRFRVSWQALNTCNDGFSSSTCEDWTGTVRSNLLRTFTGGHKTNFYQWLHRLPANSGTPLRSAMVRAGNFYMSTGLNSPRASDPGVAENPISACRANFHFMMTDGIWNSDSVSVGNLDGSGGGFPDGASYSPRNPFRDNNSSSLADIAFRYWSQDLQPTVANNMPPYYPVKTGPGGAPAAADYWDARNDPATWQHMVNFTVGLGLGASLTSTSRPEWAGDTYAGDYPNLVNGSVAWPATAADAPGNVADLWHAAINSRGQFFSVDNPQSILDAFTQILNRITQQVTSVGQGGSSSRRVSSGTLAYTLKLVPGDWYGTLAANQLYLDGSQGPEVWSTNGTFTSDAGGTRKIFVSVPVGPSGTVTRTFEWNSFSPTQQATYFGSDQNLFNWLRGDRSREGNPYRVRKQLLGDVIRSDLTVLTKADFGYSSLPAIGSAYAAHVASKQPLVFVGSNDGMLHAFDGINGSEKFAYVPSSSLANMASLASQNYVHRDFVDGPLAIYDAYIGGWKTILIGGLGSGGKSVFILDVTNAMRGGTFGVSDVIMELNDPDLGYSFGKPIVGRLRNGDWVAIIPNGYGAASNKAMLFVVNLTTKAVTKIDTGSGSAGTPNGLSSPTYLEFEPGFIRMIYAGDYRGNLWRFDVSSTGAITVGLSGQPLFTAKDPAGAVQPITAEPRIVPFPAGGVMVLFGTGKYFETTDRTSRSVQSFYGIRDISVPVTGRAQLVAQTLTSGTSIDSGADRSLSTNAVDYATRRGWYIDFNTTYGGSASGERIVAPAFLAGETVLFNTFAPSTDPCQGVGASYLMFANAYAGTITSPQIDTNGDGKIDSSDLVGGAGRKYAGEGVLFGPFTVSVGASRGLNPSDPPPASGPCTPDGGVMGPSGCCGTSIPKNGICSPAQCTNGWRTNTGQCIKEGPKMRWSELQ